MTGFTFYMSHVFILCAAQSAHWIATTGDVAGHNTQLTKPPECTLDNKTYGIAANKRYGSLIAVQCCSKGVGSRPGCYGYENGATYNEAVAHCSGYGLTLCSKSEILSKVGQATGCDFDYFHVWTSDTCGTYSTDTITHSKTMDNHIIVIIALSCVVCICAVLLVTTFCCRKRTADRGTSAEQSDTAPPLPIYADVAKQATNTVATNGEPNGCDQHEGVGYDINEKGAEEVKLWLQSIGCSQHYVVFIKNGFDSMEMIKEIKTVNDLNHIGISLKAFQLKLLNHINQLK